MTKKLLKNLFKIEFKGNIGMGTVYLIGLLVLIGVVGTELTDGLVPTRLPINQGVAVTPKIENRDTDPGKKNLQLYTFGFTTPASTTPLIPTQPPTTTCRSDIIKAPACTNVPCTAYEAAACDEKPCNSPGQNLPGLYGEKYNCAYISWVIPGQDPNPILLSIEPYKSQNAAYQQKINDPNCVAACFGKPVIYLYPEKPTLVDVELIIPGSVIESDPLYPEGGWKNVLAHPDGKLIYKNNKYHELYYESQVDYVNAPDNGKVIATQNLKAELNKITAQLGLIKFERDEFLDYWLPRLYKLNSPYVLFSVIDPVEKERVDHVSISPEPDTRIEFLAYFKPQMSSSTELNPLPLPTEIPQRIGFTAVEWGGTIAY